MFYLLSDSFFYLPGKKQWTCCITSLPGVDAFHQCMVWMLFLTVTQRGSPAKITSLIYTAERKWHKTQQCLRRLSLLCFPFLWMNYLMCIIQAEIQLDHCICNLFDFCQDFCFLVNSLVEECNK